MQQRMQRAKNPPAPAAIGIIGIFFPSETLSVSNAKVSYLCTSIFLKISAFSSLVPSVQYSMAKVVLKDSFYGTAASNKLDPFSTSYYVFRDVELFMV